MSDIQKMIDEGRAWRGSNAEGLYVYAPYQLKLLLEQVVKEQRRADSVVAGDCMKWVRKNQLVTNDLTFNKDSHEASN